MRGFVCPAFWCITFQTVGEKWRMLRWTIDIYSDRLWAFYLYNWIISQHFLMINMYCWAYEKVQQLYSSISSLPRPTILFHPNIFTHSSCYWSCYTWVGLLLRRKHKSFRLFQTMYLDVVFASPSYHFLMNLVPLFATDNST